MGESEKSPVLALSLPQPVAVRTGCAWRVEMARLVVDSRERQLIKLLGGSVDVRTLDVGDVLCQHEDGSGWVAERKTTNDLAASLRDGRWAEQRDRLYKSGLTVTSRQGGTG